MGIRYRVQKQELLGLDMFVARVELKGTYSREMLINRILEMGSTITKADIVAVMTNFEKAVKNICLEGNKITMDGFMQFTPSIDGRFNSEMDGFNSANNSVYVTAQISSAFNNDFGLQASLEKVASYERKPSIVGVYDIQTKENNVGVTKNNIVSLGGENLKFDPASTEEYLRFVNKNTISEFIPITQIQKATDREIVFLLPDTTYTEGYFEVAAKLNTLSLRTGRSVNLIVH